MKIAEISEVRDLKNEKKKLTTTRKYLYMQKVNSFFAFSKEEKWKTYINQFKKRVASRLVKLAKEQGWFDNIDMFLIQEGEKKSIQKGEIKITFTGSYIVPKNHLSL